MSCEGPERHLRTCTHWFRDRSPRWSAVVVAYVIGFAAGLAAHRRAR